MTGFASLDAPVPGGAAQWEMRAVNGRGLELRLRLPESAGALETALRARLGARLARGNVSLSLRLTQEGAAVGLNPQGLAQAVQLLTRASDAAAAAGLSLTPASVSDLLAMRGVIEGTERADLPLETLLAQAETLIDAFDASRAAEGAALAAILGAQIDRIAALVAQARALLPERRAAQGAQVAALLARLADTPADPARLEQELALWAVKSDVAEELDRLDAHVGAARDLIAQGGPVGRRFDFLTQEFNREANTLCSKAQHAGLTKIGLDLKTLIDQMREQVQNVE
jgi:uncharacterized protein (TIGR00255 family)